MCRNIPKLLTAPADAIAAARKKSTYGDALATLIFDGIVLAIATAVFLTVLGSITGLGAMFGQGLGIVAVVVFVAVFLGGLFLALLTKLVVRALGGKGDFLHGLTISSYTMAAPSVGLLVTAIFFAVPYIGPIIGFIAMALGFALGISTLYRAIKELFVTDMITALVAVGVLTLALMTAFVIFTPSMGMGSLTTLTNLAGLV
ncbi:MAG: YIP1 family protein [archaeon]